MFLKIFAICLALIIVTDAAQINPCPNSKGTKVQQDDVIITDCPREKCTLKRKSKFNLEFKFTPDRDFKEISNQITGIILEVPLPFPGVYGTSACSQIFDKEGKENVGCPLKAGTTYTYKNSFEILQIYPKLDNIIVHYALADKQGDASCFEITARIR